VQAPDTVASQHLSRRGTADPHNSPFKQVDVLCDFKHVLKVHVGPMHTVKALVEYVAQANRHNNVPLTLWGMRPCPWFLMLRLLPRF
jgi:hypothetical protein